MKKLIAFGICITAVAIARAAEPESPAGTWKTIDDKSGHAKSIVQITERDGELTGKVVKVLESEYGPHPICKECTGERKDQPIEGMTILWGVRHNGTVWNGGEVLDPKNGKIYRAKLTPNEGGKKLEVRGYLGVSLLGRTQTWIREK